MNSMLKLCMLKDSEVDINIMMNIINKTYPSQSTKDSTYSPNKKGMDINSIEIIKHWIFSLSERK